MHFLINFWPNFNSKNSHIYHRRSTANLIFTSSHYLVHLYHILYLYSGRDAACKLVQKITTVCYTWNVSKFAFIDFSRVPCFRFYAFLEYLLYVCILYIKEHRQYMPWVQKCTVCAEWLLSGSGTAICEASFYRGGLGEDKIAVFLV